jgi:uncharacterized protein YjbI with pentapeptide repeats
MRQTDEPVQVFTAGEKRLLRGNLFRGADFDHVDFSAADLRDTMFEWVSLRGCDFSDANLRGAVFHGCDLRCARFARASFGDNRFDECWFVGATGIVPLQRVRIEECGGNFLALSKAERRK